MYRVERDLGTIYRLYSYQTHRSIPATCHLQPAIGYFFYDPGHVRIMFLGYFYRNSKFDPLAVFLIEHPVARSPLNHPLNKIPKTCNILSFISTFNNSLIKIKKNFLVFFLIIYIVCRGEEEVGGRVTIADPLDPNLVTFTPRDPGPGSQYLKIVVVGL